MGSGVVQIEGRVVRYSDTGGTGPVVVFGHGFFLDHTIFDDVASRLSPCWRVIGWDARGHGGSTEDGSVFTYWDLARDVLGLLDAVGVESAVLGGISQGGFIALRAALLAPERVNGLILMDTEATACHPSDQSGYRTLFSALAEHGPIDELALPLARQLVGDNIHAPDWVRRWQRSGQLPLAAPAECLLGRDDIVDRLPRITCPALLIWGDQDQSLPRDRMDLLHSRLPAATSVQVVEGAAHTPALSHPNVVADLITGFMTRVHQPPTG